MWQLFSLPFFAYAAWQDMRTRRVPAWVWLPLAVAGLYPVWKHPMEAAVSISVTAAIVGALHLYGQFGLADVKASIVLAMLFPVYPDVMLSPEFGIFAITVLLNATIVALVTWVVTHDAELRKNAPFVAFMFVGLLIALLVGDPLAAGIQSVMSPG